MVKNTLNSIKTLLIKEQREILSAASMLMILGLVTKITGMLFLSLMSGVFGSNTDTELFFLASVVPETITNVILMGAISGSVIPIFIKLKEEEGEQSFLHSFSSTVNLSMLVFVFLSALAALYANQLMPLALELSQKKEILTTVQVDQVVAMMRVMLIAQVTLAISAFISTSLNIYNRFIIPQLAPLFFNVGRIIGILVLVPLMGNSIWGIVWGTVLGSFLHLLIQVPLLSHLNIKLRWFFIDLKDRSFIKVLHLGLPRILSLGAEQIAAITDSIIAFSLSTVAHSMTYGPLTAYNLAVRLISFPLHLFGTSFAIASFPSLSRLYANNQHDELSALVSKIINEVIFLTLPVSVLLLVLRVPIVRLAYGIFGGGFEWEDTLQVAWIVLFFSLGLTFEALRSAMLRIFYAVHDSIVPFLSSLMVVVLGIVSGILFTNYFSHFSTFSLKDVSLDFSLFLTRGDGPMGVGGLGLSSSFVFSLEFFILLIILRKKRVIRKLRPLAKQIFKKLLAGAIMFLAAYAMVKVWDEILNTAKTLQLIVLTITTSISAIMLYIWTCFVFKIPEVSLFVGFAAHSLKKILKRTN